MRMHASMQQEAAQTNCKCCCCSGLPSFWEKTVELVREMLRANANITTGHAWGSNLLQWPTLLTLAMFPVLVWMYSRLSIHEERETEKAFGSDWRAYAARTPRFIPRLRNLRRKEIEEQE